MHGLPDDQKEGHRYAPYLDDGPDRTSSELPRIAGAAMTFALDTEGVMSAGFWVSRIPEIIHMEAIRIVEKLKMPADLAVHEGHPVCRVTLCPHFL